LVDTVDVETGEPIFLAAFIAMGLYFVIFNESAARNSIEIHRRFGYTGTLRQSRWISVLVGAAIVAIGTTRSLYLVLA
jgi:hypothetical protein